MRPRLALACYSLWCAAMILLMVYSKLREG